MKILTKIAGVLLAGVAVSAAATKALAWRAERRNPPVGDFIECDGVRLHYLDRGPRDGQPVVFLPGNGAPIQDFAISGILDLAAQRYRVICFDRPGYGWSERPRGVDWTPEAQGKLIARAMRQLQLKNAIVMGHSWGTLVAIGVALAAPDLVRGLVLASGYYFPSTRREVGLLVAPAIPGIGDLLRWTVAPLAGRALGPAAVKLIFSPRPVPDNFVSSFPFEMAMRPISTRASTEEAAVMVAATERLQGEYANLRMPVTVVVGDGDKLIEPAQSGRLVHVLPNASFIEVREAGHMVHHAAPERMIEAIDRVAGPRALPAAA